MKDMKDNKNQKPDRENRRWKGNKKKSNSSKYSRGERKDSNKIVKNRRTDGADERYASETAPSMKNPNVKNDASWYTYSSDVINVAGTINFNDPIGNPFSDAPTILNEAGTKKAFATDPSVMAIGWCPTPGNTGVGGYPNTATNAPVNLQIRSLYTLMQATVTQNLPFAAADLGVHIFYMDNVYIMWGYLQRLYYILRRYDVMNRTLPKTLINAYGLHSSILQNPAYTINDFQSDLLSLEQEVRRIAIPAGFDVLNRHYWMTKHVFMDQQSTKPQLYMFIPQYIWGFDDQGETGGELILNRIPHDQTENGLKNLVTWFRTYLNKFYNDKDVWTLNGYVLRAFNNFWVPDALDISGIIQPVYAPEVLPQIHNATPVGTIFGARTSQVNDYEAQILQEHPTHGRIVQDIHDNVVWLPAMRYQSLGQGAVMDERIMIDMPMPIPTPADNLVATRLITRAANTTFVLEGAEVALITIYGTEIVTDIAVLDGVNESSNGTMNLGNFGLWGVSIFDEGTEGLIMNVEQMLRIGQLSKFTSAPLYPMTIDHGTPASVHGWFDFIGEMNHYTVVNQSVLKKLHDAAALGEWLIK